MGSGASSSKYLFKSTMDTQIQSVEWIANANSFRSSSMNYSDFKAITPIGKGKFGHVYLSQHIPSQKHVAIKYISKKIIHECQAVERIQQEIDTLLTLRHSFIVQYYGAFESPGCIALVFEFAFGGELFTRMKKQSKFSEDVAKFYFCELVCALSYLHEQKIVYRDLKPENILLDIGGHVKLCDFGFAVTITNINEALHDGCGTAMYVAPEIAEGFMKRSHGFPVDWWSLGCVLYEMLTGHAPFGDTDSSSKFEIFNNINSKEVSFPMMMNKDVKTVCKGLMTKDPNQRFSAVEVKNCAWLEKVNWDHVNQRLLLPPWIPEVPQAPTTSNFLTWKETINVNEPADTASAGYCSIINISAVPTFDRRASSHERREVGDERGMQRAMSRKASMSASSGPNAMVAGSPPPQLPPLAKRASSRAALQNAQSSRDLNVGPSAKSKKLSQKS